MKLRCFFELSEDHLKLLRAMNVSWDDCEFGAPAIDPKRPYGNSHVYEDMAKILGIKAFEDTVGEKHFLKEDIDLMDKFHKETKIALQIVLMTGRFEPGIYETDEYRTNWKLKGGRHEL